MHLKKSLGFLVLLLVTAMSFTSCKQKQEDVLAGIKKEYTKINEKLKDYTPKRVDDITSQAGGTINGFFRDDEVKKILAEHFTDTCRTFTEYYFDDGMLIYMVKQNYVYNKPVSYTEEKAKANNDSVWYDDKKTKLEISKFFFNKNKLIKWVAPGNVDVPVNSPDFAEKESILWAETIILLKQLKD